MAGLGKIFAEALETMDDEDATSVSPVVLPSPAPVGQSKITDFFRLVATTTASSPPVAACPLAAPQKLPKPRKSYAGVVGTDSFPNVSALPDPIQTGNITRIQIPQEAYEEQLRSMQFTLIGWVNFRFASMDDLRKSAKDSWGLSAHVEMVSLGKGFVSFRFQMESDMTMVFRRSPFRLGKQYIRFRRWKPDFNIHEDHVSTKLVWIRFPELPLEYWHETILVSIAKAMGHPMALDKRTKRGMAGHYARVLVEVDLSLPRLDEVQVERCHPGTSELFCCKQRVIYEDSLNQCAYCRRVGHRIAECVAKRAADAKKRFTIPVTSSDSPVPEVAVQPEAGEAVHLDAHPNLVCVNVNDVNTIKDTASALVGDNVNSALPFSRGFSPPI